MKKAKNPSLITRIAIGKGVGVLVGGIGFVMLPYFLPESGLLIRWGVLLWYTTFGAIIGVFGVIVRCPVLNIPIPWWFRASLIGAWLNFVLVFFAYDMMAAVMVALFGPDGFLASPFWFVLEGAIVALLVDNFATRYGGEGKGVLDGGFR